MTDLDEALKNGTALTYVPPPALVQLAQNLLEGVMSGQIRSLAAITVGPTGQITWPIVGNHASEILHGAEFLRDDVKAMMRKPQGRIIKAG